MLIRVLLPVILFLPLECICQQQSDTLTKGYLVAVDNWLFGRDELARQQLLAMPTRVGSTEQVSAWGLLLDEYYFWPGHYQRYLQLADSLHIATSFYNTAAILAQQPPEQHRLASDSLVFPIRIKHKSHPVVDVVINGKISHLIIDTGAQLTMLSNRFAKRANVIKLADLSVTNYNGRNVSATLLRIDSLELNGLTIKNVPAHKARMPHFLDGLLGWDILRQYKIVIDYAKRQLTLGRSVPATGLQPNLLGGSRPMLLLHNESGNNQLNIMLDTGANHTFSISPTGLRKIGPYDQKSRIAFSSAVGQSIHISREQFVKKLTVRLGEKSYSFRKSAIFPNDEMIGLILRDGLIGSGAFRDGVLIIDAPNHWFAYHSNAK